MRTTNPTLNENVFRAEAGVSYGSTMTLQGTVNKSFLLILLVLLTATISWTYSASALVGPMIMGGAIVGFILAIVTVFKKSWSPVTAPAYALAEGFFLGGISAFFEQSFPGIVVLAISLTLGIFVCLLLAYSSGIIKATENFKLGVFAATGAIGLVYLVSFVMNMFGSQIPYIHDNGIIGIAFSGIVVVVAALNLVLDFDFIEQGAESPKTNIHNS